MLDLFPHYEGSTILINGQEFTLTKDEELSGELATWKSKSYIIHATLGFDNICVPVDVLTNDYLVIDFESSYEDIFSYEEYVKKVKEMSEEIIKKFEEGL